MATDFCGAVLSEIELAVLDALEGLLCLQELAEAPHVQRINVQQADALLLAKIHGRLDRIDKLARTIGTSLAA